MKNNVLFKRVILFENVLLLLLTVISTTVFLCGPSAGMGIFIYSSYIAYPLILLTFFIALLCKRVVIREYKVNIGLFLANLAISFFGFLAFLYKIADALAAF